ncbi:retrovirus-related pol polyprotein from transposon TNT 1-94 [Tanacetum coccineum]
MFNEYFNPPSSDVSPVPIAVEPRAVEIAATPSSTTIDQDIEAMQEEIHEFERLQVWELVPCPDKVMLIKFKWTFKVKTDEFCGILKNKERLAAQGFRQEEGIDFKESFASVVRIEVILPVAVAPRAVEIAATPSSTTIDQDAPSSTNQQQQSSIISQGVEEPIPNAHFDDPYHEPPHNVSTSQESSSNVQSSHSPLELINTPMVEKNKLDADLQGTPVDATHYRGMIRSIMYLTSSRPNLIYAVCLCARYQAKPIEKYLNVVKRIFRYLKGTINMGLTMTTTTAQQVALDNALVPLEKRVKICLRLPNQHFDELLSDEDIVSFIKELGHKGDIKSITEVVVDHMYQPWRTFAAIINKCLSGKITGLDKL